MFRFSEIIFIINGNPYVMPPNAREIQDKVTFWLGWGALGLLMLGYLIGSSIHLPIAFVALLIALVMLVIVHVRKLKSAADILKAALWSILVYAIGMFIVITAAYEMNILNLVMQPLRDFAGSDTKALSILFPGAILAFLSAIFNNLPATLIGVLALRHVDDVSSSVLYASILGLNIGPKITPFGSLAALIIF